MAEHWKHDDFVRAVHDAQTSLPNIVTDPADVLNLATEALHVATGHRETLDALAAAREEATTLLTEKLTLAQLLTEAEVERDAARAEAEALAAALEFYADPDTWRWTPLATYTGNSTIPGATCEAIRDNGMKAVAALTAAPRRARGRRGDGDGVLSMVRGT